MRKLVSMSDEARKQAKQNAALKGISMTKYFDNLILEDYSLKPCKKKRGDNDFFF